MSPEFHLSNPPAKPILLWDGDCRFCRLWVERWRVITGGRIDDAAFQQAASRFPEIPRQEFDHAIVYVDQEGKVFSAARAIFPSIRRPVYAALNWSYNHVPPFAPVWEWFYRFITLCA